MTLNISNLLAFLAIPNGYSEAMHIFTVILKPSFKVSREEGHLSLVYMDNLYLKGDTHEECCGNILDTESTAFLGLYH